MEKKQPGGATRYTYDDLNQLTKVEYPGYTEELYYDKAGNRSRRIAGGVEEEYRYDPAGHLTEYTKGGTTTTFTYDNAGNLTADNKARYTYDLFNRTEKVETFDGHVQINHYDAEGLRSGIEEDGRLVQFIFREQEVVTELETEKSMTRFIRGYDLIASDADSARTYYHYASDEMGSITHVVVGEDILNRYEYDAWGNLTLCEEKVENRFKFNGQQYDPISQQYYLRARYYNPVIGRFTQEDTYRGDGLNLYAYCRNNPVYYADPSGHYRQCVKDAYDRIRKENPDMPAADAYKRALAETGANNILKKPIFQWTDADLQRAVDSIHNAQFNGSWWGNLSPMAVTVDSEGRVVVTKNNGPIRENSRAGQMARQIFGPDVEFPTGRGSNYPRIFGDSTFTQEDTYRGDGLNLYAYCANNPVYYADPSGHYRNCVKDAYDRIRKENPGMSAQDAYNLALKETGKDRIPNDATQNTEQNRRRNPAAEGPDGPGDSDTPARYGSPYSMLSPAQRRRLKE